jgi:ATP-dependent Lhr-like helicase
VRLERELRAAVAEGRVAADAFSPLAWLLRPRSQRRRGRRGAEPLGRWSLLAPPEAPREPGPAATQQALAAVCSALLRRYGVVFRAVLARETGLPPWRLLLACLRRMEDRGEVRGGRFVDGFSGEQFALAEAVGALRQGGDADALRAVSACDPLNLGGYLAPGPRTPALPANRVVLRAGLPVARACGERVEFLVSLGRSERERALVALGVVDEGAPLAVDRAGVAFAANDPTGGGARAVGRLGVRTN